MRKTIFFVAAGVLVFLPFLNAAEKKAAPEKDKTEATKDTAAPEETYMWFNKFCAENFGAEKEPLVYQKFGEALQISAGGSWNHISEKSACFAWETNLPSKTYVEYGETTSYGNKTALPERFFYLQLHYLKGLEIGKTYHYRLVATDERGRTIKTEDAVFETKKIPGAIHIPGTLGEPPYTLDRKDATYILDKDIVSATLGAKIAASGVTLDLNGFSITYDEGTPKVKSEKWGEYANNDEATHGVRIKDKFTGIKILNGTIKQGKNNGKGITGIGFNPVYNKAHSVEIAGVTVEYSGDDVSGIREVSDIHHCVVTDKGAGIKNRHQGLDAITGYYGRNTPEKGYEIHHVLVKRCRHRGIVNYKNYFNNEVYLDSYATNSYGLGLIYGSDTKYVNNRIFGGGYHVCAFAWGNKSQFINNFVHLKGEKLPDKRSKEYGDSASVNGFRLTQYNKGKVPYENNLYSDNTVVIKVKDKRQARGVQFFSDPYVKDLVFKNSTIKVEAED
ncbi:MAG: hypothetical protein WCK36_03185, partial [Candidatus Firestonebacteria bacterium]